MRYACGLIQGKLLLKNMYDMFMARDCTLLEINPLAETPDGRGTNGIARRKPKAKGSKMKDVEVQVVVN